MKSLWIILFGLLCAVFVGVFATAIYATLHDDNKQSPELAARQVECRNLARHVIEISPQRGQRSVEELLAKVPVEDIEQCGAAYPEVVSCMEKASDVAGVRACVPKHVDCTGPETVVEGTQPIYEVSGDCRKLVIKTTNAFIVVKSSREPTIQDTGSGNRVEHVR